VPESWMSQKSLVTSLVAGQSTRTCPYQIPALHRRCLPCALDSPLVAHRYECTVCAAHFTSEGALYSHYVNEHPM
jgi:hypothetical protein